MYKLFLLALIVHINADGGYYENTNPPGKCLPGNMILNDCNWCKCSHGKYVCQNKVCNKADKFQHFNDAIEDITDIGMEGHGSWRQRVLDCEPGISYIKGDVMCICSDIGDWPNPICRSYFKSLRQTNLIAHHVMPQDLRSCNPGELYAFGCYVCHCPFEARIDSTFCADKLCPQINVNSELSHFLRSDEVEVFAECHIDAKYIIGVQECYCVDDNTLVCRKTRAKSKELIKVDDLCEGRTGYFKIDCNSCYCDQNGYRFCTNHACRDNEYHHQLKSYHILENY